MFSFAVDYYLLVSVSAFAVIQIAASVGGLNGLVLLRSRRATWISALGVAALALVWFFAVEDRNINDYEGGIDANIQSLLFFLGASTAYASTLGMSSVVNNRIDDGDPKPVEGLGAMRRTTFARALGRSLKYWWSEWRTQTRPYLFG
jgi:hypothetical protein